MVRQGCVEGCFASELNLGLCAFGGGDELRGQVRFWIVGRQQYFRGRMVSLMRRRERCGVVGWAQDGGDESLSGAAVRRVRDVGARILAFPGVAVAPSDVETYAQATLRVGGMELSKSS